MEISLHGIKSLTAEPIHKIIEKYARTIRVETKDGEKFELTLFDAEVANLIIKKE